MVSQKQAVTNAVLAVKPDYELNGETCLADVTTSEEKKQMRAILFEGFKAGEIAMTEQAQDKYLGDDTALTKYVSGLLDNWIRKNTEFNNGQKYVTKNPGSRAGSGDEQVKEMRKLLKVTQDAESRKLIEQAISDRLAEIKPEANIEINAAALPEHLRHLV